MYKGKPQWMVFNLEVFAGANGKKVDIFDSNCEEFVALEIYATRSAPVMLPQSASHCVRYPPARREGDKEVTPGNVKAECHLII